MHVNNEAALLVYVRVRVCMGMGMGMGMYICIRMPEWACGTFAFVRAQTTERRTTRLHLAVETRPASAFLSTSARASWAKSENHEKRGDWLSFRDS